MHTIILILWGAGCLAVALAVFALLHRTFRRPGARKASLIGKMTSTHYGGARKSHTVTDYFFTFVCGKEKLVLQVSAGEYEKHRKGEWGTLLSKSEKYVAFQSHGAVREQDETPE